MSKTLGLLGACILLFALAAPPVLRPLHYLAGDAYFYPVIAHNIVTGYGSTFNTITTTKGYHPLWLVVCVGLAGLALNVKGVTMVLAIVTGQVLTLLVLAGSRKAAGNLNLRYWWLGAPVLAAFFLSGLYCSEAHLNGFLVLMSLVLLRYWITTTDRGLITDLHLGFGFECSILARLDNVFIVFSLLVTIIVYILWKPEVPSVSSRLSRFAAVVISTVAPVVGYLVYNFATTQHMMPISGAIKSTFPVVTLGFSSHLGATGVLTFAFALSGIALAVFSKVTRQRIVLASLSIGVLLHATYVILFTDNITQWSWYYVPGMVNLAFVLVMLANMIVNHVEVTLRQSARMYLDGAIVLRALLLTAYALTHTLVRFHDPDAIHSSTPLFALKTNMAQERWQSLVGLWLQQHLPSGTRIIVYDFPGAISYVSGLQILPVDG